MWRTPLTNFISRVLNYGYNRSSIPRHCFGVSDIVFIEMPKMKPSTQVSGLLHLARVNLIEENSRRKLLVVCNDHPKNYTASSLSSSKEYHARVSHYACKSEALHERNHTPQQCPGLWASEWKINNEGEAYYWGKHICHNDVRNEMTYAQLGRCFVTGHFVEILVRRRAKNRFWGQNSLLCLVHYPN